jgi:hypothetical protein
MMTFLRVFCLLVLLLLVACAPVIVTETPQPTVPPITPTATPDPGAYFVPINEGSDLAGAVTFWDEQKGVNNVRRLVLPAWADFVNNMLIVRDDGEEDCGWLPPYIYNQDVERGLFLIEPEWLCGTWALAQNNIRIEPGRYILKMTYAKLRLSPSAGEVWQNGNVADFPTVYMSDGNSYQFTHQALPSRDNDLEHIWVFETDRLLYIRVEWSWHIEWPSVIGSFVLDNLDVLTAPPDFGDDVVVRF